VILAPLTITNKATNEKSDAAAAGTGAAIFSEPKLVEVCID
jgi:hypothetical protein